MAWKKGQTGNAGGRPKKAPELREVEALARSASPDAIKRLEYWMKQDNARASVAACNAILDRAFGKPSQAMTVQANVSHDLSGVSDAELSAIVAGAIGSGRNSAKASNPEKLH